MPKKIIDDSDSSSESEPEPEQYEKENIEPKVKITKLEKPKRVMSEKQLENLKRGRENRVKARQEKQLQEKQLQETSKEPVPEPVPEPVQVAAVEPTREPSTVVIKEVKKPLSKLNKKQLKIEADLLNIDINNLTNAEIIKKIRESQGKQDTPKIDKAKLDTSKIDTPKKKISVKQTVKEIHHHHYKKEDDPKIQEKAQGVFNKPSVTIKKESKIINFV